MFSDHDKERFCRKINFLLLVLLWLWLDAFFAYININWHVKLFSFGPETSFSILGGVKMVGITV